MEDFYDRTPHQTDYEIEQWSANTFVFAYIYHLVLQ